MVTFISFLIILFGCVNWMSIGMLQYDIVAGFFGTQSSMFSRLIYILIGFAALWFIVSVIRQKGKINIFKNKIEKKEVYHREERMNESREHDREYDRGYEKYER